MKKLIELGVAIDAAIGAADEWDCDFSFERDRKIRDVFMALPTVDAVPVAHGRWTDKDGGIATCSVCGDRWGVWSVMKYCPNCGALMDGKDGDQNG